MKHIRKGICVSISIIMVILCLAACQNAGSSAEGASVPQQDASAPDNSGGGEKVKITFWDMPWGGNDYKDVATALVDKFNQQSSSIEVAYQFTAWDNFMQTFSTAIASNSAPDASTGGGVQQHFFAKSGAILELDSIVEQWKQDGTLDDFVNGAIDAGKYNGKQIGIPWNTDPRVIYYRKDLFSKAGIDKLPTDWDELRAAGQKLKAAGVTPFVFRLGDLLGNHLFKAFASQNGAGELNDNNEIVADSEEMKQMLQYLRDLQKDGFFYEGIAGLKGDEAKQLFSSKDIGMMFEEPSYIFAADQDFMKNVGILPTIKGYAGYDNTFGPKNFIMGYNQTQHPEEAKEFIKWWSENSIDLFTKGSVNPFPVRNSFLKNEKYSGNEYLKYIIDEYIPRCAPFSYPKKELYPEMNSIDGEGVGARTLQELFTTDKSVDEVAADLRKMVEDIMRQ